MMAAPSTAGLVSLDVDAMSSWIDELRVGARAPLRFARIGRGQSNLTFAVADRDGRRWVLRRPPLGRLLGSAHDVAREHRILTALQDTDVPAPRVLGLCSDPRVGEVPLVLMEHVDGLRANLRPAGQLGIATVLHRDAATMTAELERLLQIL